MKKYDINSTEIARLAGVSRSTVSRVINNYSNVPPETREKVMKVIREQRYVPNVSAQVLAGKKNRTIGLFIIDKGHVAGDSLTAMLIASVIEHASARGYYVLTHIIRTTRDEEQVRRVKEAFYQKRIDGGLFIGADNQEELVEELISDGFAVGIVDQELPGRSEPNRIVVNFDNETAVRLAVTYLVEELGHRRIGMIQGDMNRLSGPAKFGAFLQCMADWRLPVEEQWVLPGAFNETGGYEAARLLLERHACSPEAGLPTALVAANDSAAFGAIRALNEQGISVPGEISVIGFDDHAMSERFIPPLTTIRVDFHEMMEQLTTRLISYITEEYETQAPPFQAGAMLIRRGSCRKLEA